MPELFIITGSNGAGKSSIGPKYLPQRIRERGPVFDGYKLFVEKRKELWRNIKSHKECAKLAIISMVSEYYGTVSNPVVPTKSQIKIDQSL